MLLDLAGWDPTAAAMARRAADEATPDRHGAAGVLAEHVLAPVGGPMPLAWSIDWEELAQ